MPMLLEDLAKEASASIARAADRLDRESRELEGLRQADAGFEELRQKAVESARQATDYALSQLSQAEGLWRSALTALRQKPTGEDAERLLRDLLGVFESGLRLVKAPRTLWAFAEAAGAAPERLDELDRARGRFEELAAEANRALEHRTRGWQPADPDRLEQGLRLSAEGKTTKADEARARFRQG
jgi:hypothetical protein